MKLSKIFRFFQGKKNNRKRNQNRNKQSNKSKTTTTTTTTGEQATTVNCANKIHEIKETDVSTIDKQDLNQVKLETSTDSNLANQDQSCNNNNQQSNKMNGVKYGSNHMNGANETNLCKICSKHVYHMEQIKACKGVFHKSCFRCIECNKQLNVDSYSSNEGLIYCKPHFKQLFQPKPNFDNTTTANCNGHHLQNGHQAEQEDVSTSTTIINGKNCNTGNSTEEESKSSSKIENTVNKDLESTTTTTTTKKIEQERSPTRKYELIICENQPLELPPDVVRYDSKPQETFENLAVNLSNIRNRFENRSSSLTNNDSGSRRSLTSDKPITRSESIHKIMQKYQSRVAGDNNVSSGSDDEDLQNETPTTTNEERMSFSGMSTLKSQWENGSINANAKSEKDAVQNELEELRKKVKSSEPLKQVYERAIQEAKSTENLSNKNELILDSSVKAVSIKEKFEKGALETETEEDRIERLRKEREAEMIQISSNDAALKEARNKFKQIEAGIGRDSIDASPSTNNGHIEDVSIDSEQLQQRFSYFENLNGNQAKDEDHVEHSSTKVADDIPKVDTTKKMLSKFKALEAGQVNGNGDLSNANNSPKQPKRITPPRESTKVYENDPLVERDPNIVKSSYKTDDVIQVKPEMARNLRAKFENWQTEIERENRKDDAENDFVPLERDSTKNIRAMFENIQNEPSKPVEKPRPRVNRFV